MKEETREDKIQNILKHCLFTSAEVLMSTSKIPKDAIMIEGIVTLYGFNQDRLEEKRGDIIALIEDIVPDSFLISAGGGDSFLNLCTDKSGEQWTSFHKVMEALYCLAAGSNLAGFSAPPEMWDQLPGGMPYIWFRTSEEDELAAAGIEPA